MADVPIGLGSYVETDVASAATCDIGAATTLAVRITGTTTITSFGTGPGRRREIRFADVLTLTHNVVSLILPNGGSNIVTEAGDTCFARSGAGGNWIVYDYTRKSGQPLANTADLAVIEALTPSNDDIIQRKAGAWTNRTMAQLLTDVGAQPLDSDLTAIAALSTQSFGRSVLTQANTQALCAALGLWWPAFHTGVASSTLTGTVAETVIDTYTIPAGALGPNGMCRITALYTVSANASFTKTIRHRLGGIGGSILFSQGFTNVTNVQTLTIFHNRNAQNSQIGAPSGLTATYGSASGGPAALAIDTSTAKDIVLTGTIPDAAQTIVRESYSVEILYGA